MRHHSRRAILLASLIACGRDRAAPDAAAADAAPDAGPIVTQPTNILGNGGFEHGLVGYGEFVQPDGNNDYGFFLATAAHGGSYALEIRCLGASCGSDAGHRAFVVTNPFHMPANQDYKLVFWAKCAPGADAFWYTESASVPYLSRPIACTGDWARNEVMFTSAGDREGSFYYFNRSAGSLFVDDAVLTYADGTVPVHTVRHHGDRAAKVDASKLVVDGKPFLALGFFHVPYDELPAVAAIRGTNVVTAAGGYSLEDCFNTDRPPYADRAYELGLAVVPNLTETARLGIPAVVGDAVQTYGSHLANIGFYLADEPDLDHYQYSLIPPATLAAERAAAHATSALPLVADLQHAHYDPPAIDQPYQDGEDIYGSEPYQEDTSGIAQTFTVFGTMTPRPVWIFDDNHADASTVVAKAYYGAIRGAVGLVYFDWASLDAANRAADAQAIGELSQLADVIFAADATSEVTATAGIAFIARRAGGKTYVLAVNPTAQPIQATFAAAGATAIDVMFENRTLAATGGAFTDTFAKLSRHVYVW